MSVVYQCVIGQCGLKPYLPTNLIQTKSLTN